MTMQNGLKIGSCLLAIVLLGGLTMRAGFAEENASDKRDDAKASNQSADSVDTRIAVQPHHKGAQHGKDAKAKIESPAPGNLHRRTLPATGPAHQTVRNAIGVVVPRHDDSGERHDGVHPGNVVSTHGPAVSTTGISESPSGSQTNLETRIVRPAVIAKPVDGASVANRAPISGTGLVHRGLGSSGIGGPSTAVSGISGTTIRPKH